MSELGAAIKIGDRSGWLCHTLEEEHCNMNESKIATEVGPPKTQNPNQCDCTVNFNCMDHLRWILDSVQDQIRFGDSKAAFVVGFHTFLFGFLITQAETLAKAGNDGPDWLYCLRIVLFAMYAVFSFVSICYAIGAVIPKFGEGAPRCKIFFGHIVADYGRNYEGFHNDAVSTSRDSWLRDFTSQIVENSNIANAKHKNASAAAKWAVASVFCAFLAVVCYFAYSTYSIPIPN